MRIAVPPKLQTLTSAPIYIVGGFVRNAVMARLSNCAAVATDIDICGALPASELALAPPFVAIPVNERLGTAIITDGDDAYEYTPFRSERYRMDGSHTPISVSFGGGIEEDCHRRDFTVNALYCDVKDGEVIDPLGGIADIDNKTVRACDDADKVFMEDSLRIMRLVRQSAELGFAPDAQTLDAARRLAHLLGYCGTTTAQRGTGGISAERKRVELDKILVADQKYNTSDAHYHGLKLLGAIDAWQYVLPEVGRMDGVAQNPKYHRHDVLEHTLQCVRICPPRVRLAALLHDIGKPVCQQKDGNMYDHAEVGAELALRILGQSCLKYPNAERNRTAALVRFHMFNKDGKMRTAKLRRFIAQSYALIDDLVALMRADSSAKGYDNSPSEQPSNCAKILDERDRMARDNAPWNLSLLAVNGRDALNAGLTGRAVGDALKNLQNRCLFEGLKNDRQTLLSALQKLTKK